MPTPTPKPVPIGSIVAHAAIPSLVGRVTTNPYAPPALVERVAWQDGSEGYYHHSQLKPL